MDEKTNIEQNGTEKSLNTQSSSEFSRITWPGPKRVWSETATTVIIGAAVAVTIFFVDLGLRFGIETLIK